MPTKIELARSIRVVFSFTPLRKLRGIVMVNYVTFTNRTRIGSVDGPLNDAYRQLVEVQTKVSILISIRFLCIHIHY